MGKACLLPPEENESSSVKKHDICLLDAYLSLLWTDENSKTTKSESMPESSDLHNPDETQEHLLINAIMLYCSSLPAISFTLSIITSLGEDSFQHRYAQEEKWLQVINLFQILFWLDFIVQLLCQLSSGISFLKVYSILVVSIINIFKHSHIILLSKLAISITLNKN